MVPIIFKLTTALERAGIFTFDHERIMDSWVGRNFENDNFLGHESEVINTHVTQEESGNVGSLQPIRMLVTAGKILYRTAGHVSIDLQ